MAVVVDCWVAVAIDVVVLAVVERWVAALANVGSIVDLVVCSAAAEVVIVVEVACLADFGNGFDCM